MRITEAFLFATFIASIILFMENVLPPVAVMLAGGILIGFYTYLSHFLLRGVSLRRFSIISLLISSPFTFIAGVAYACSVTGIMFAALHFPGTSFMLAMSTIALVIISLFSSTIREEPNKATAKRVLRRCWIFILLNLLVAWLEFGDDVSFAVLKQETYSNGKMKEEVYRYGDTVYCKMFREDGSVSDYIRTYNIKPGDSFRNGHKTTYHTDGGVRADFCYKNGLKEGREVVYYFYRNPQSITFYKNGKKDSISTWFYENGMVKDVFYYDNGILKGEMISYYDDGSVKNIQFRNHSGQLIYRREYDSEGETIREQGFPAVHSISAQNLNLGDTLEIISYVAWAPDWDVSISVAQLQPSEKSSIIVANVKSKVDGRGNVILSRFIPQEKGVYMLGINVNIAEGYENETRTNRDTLFVNVR